MKKIVLLVVTFISLTTFAQKDELKTLKKIYGKESVSEKDLAEFKSNLASLEGMSLDEDQAVYAKFYKVMYPTLELYAKGDKATPMDQLKLYTPSFVKEYGEVIDATMAYETKVGKKIYYDDLVQEKNQFITQLKTIGNQAYNASQFEQASGFFYLLYTFDPKGQGQELENAAISAVQSKNYKLAEKLYDELKDSDYLNNGTIYYAKSKVSDEEETFPNRDARVKAIALGTHEKPRDEKVVTKKPEVYRMLGILASSNGNLEKAKKILAQARELNPNDQEVKNEEARIYFNEAYELLKDDQKLVDEINNNLDNKTKYDELMAKRKGVFEKALPSFEKAYSLNPDDQNTKNLLKMSYEVVGQKDKAATVK
ncbi:hypothetical protein [Flavobacterium sp.]|uniref:tetratricopeptide repeat protein n=1 Tax=Flavobacterium sp. TaxID=239 RepID=UPI003527B53D